MATVNIDDLLFELRGHINFLTGYFTNGNNQISEAITEDDFTVERPKILRLMRLLETLEEYLIAGKIKISQIAKDCKMATDLLFLLMEVEEKMGSHRDFPNVQKCNDLATINTTNIHK